MAALLDRALFRLVQAVQQGEITQPPANIRRRRHRPHAAHHTGSAANCQSGAMSRFETHSGTKQYRMQGYRGFDACEKGDLGGIA
jgi:hypothetical protein